MSALAIENLSKSFGGLRVTRNVNLNVEQGERRLIIGPNGAGKTTLFNLITGELTPDAGDVLVDLCARQQLSLHRLATRVANHPGAAANDRDRRMAEALQPGETHDRQQRSDMKARCGRIEADVGRDVFAGEEFGQPFGVLRHEAAPRELLENIRHGR